MDTNGKNVSPLLNDAVIRNLFKFVGFSDLKTCRLICSKWLALSHPFLKRSVQFTFRLENTTRDSQEDDQEWKMLDIFLQNLDDSQDILFAFIPVAQRLEGVCRIIEDHRDLIKKLKIGKIIEIAPAKPKMLYDFSKTIFNCHLTELKISSTNISISMDCLRSIESIDLAKCIVLLPRRGKIAPKYFHIFSVTFKANDEIVDHVEISDFLDFSRLKNLGLGPSSFSSKGEQMLGFDGTDSGISLDYLFVSGADRFNWPNLNWSIKLLQISHMFSCALSFLNIKPSTNIQNLRISLLDSRMKGISWIPKTLSKLTLDHSNLWPQNSLPTSLPNLKYLSLKTSYYTEDFSFLENFSDSLPNLKYLEIMHDTPHNRLEDVNQIKVQFIPPHVKKIKLKGKFQVSGNPRFVLLSSLILVDFTYQDIEDLLGYLTPESLTINGLLDMDYINSIIDLQAKRPSIKQITAGECKWENVKNIRKSYACTKFVLFETGNQTAITAKEFENAVSL